MKISKCMTRDVQLTSPTQSIRDAARTMADIDAGSLPVGEDNRLVGMGLGCLSCELRLLAFTPPWGHRTRGDCPGWYACD